MKTLTREMILQADDLTRELVEVPEWGGKFYVRALTGNERDIYEAAMLNFQGMESNINLENARARLVSLTAVDKEGKRLFSDEDVKLLGNKSARALQRVFKVAQRLSGISAEDLKEIAKNETEAEISLPHDQAEEK